MHLIEKVHFMNVRTKTAYMKLNTNTYLVFVNCPLMTLQIEIYRNKTRSDKHYHGGISS